MDVGAPPCSWYEIMNWDEVVDAFGMQGGKQKKGHEQLAREHRYSKGERKVYKKQMRRMSRSTPLLRRTWPSSERAHKIQRAR